MQHNPSRYRQGGRPKGSFPALTAVKQCPKGCAAYFYKGNPKPDTFASGTTASWVCLGAAPQKVSLANATSTPWVCRARGCHLRPFASGMLHPMGMLGDCSPEGFCQWNHHSMGHLCQWKPMLGAIPQRVSMANATIPPWVCLGIAPQRDFNNEPPWICVTWKAIPGPGPGSPKPLPKILPVKSSVHDVQKSNTCDVIMNHRMGQCGP